MTVEIASSDISLLDILRTRDSVTVTELVELLGVTATAVRQRLTRLMAQGFVDRVALRAGRGRPSHQYVLTAAGRRKTGANFADLAIALWQEIRAIDDPEVRKGLLQRISRRLAELYEDRVTGDTLVERMEAVAELFSSRQMPFSVDKQGELPVLKALACPYPDLAEQDRTVCSMERMLFSELIGQPIRLSNCTFDDDGAHYCSFEVSGDHAGPDIVPLNV
jgi:predicted ArsR family transcriptional regulator